MASKHLSHQFLLKTKSQRSPCRITSKLRDFFSTGFTVTDTACAFFFFTTCHEQKYTQAFPYMAPTILKSDRQTIKSLYDYHWWSQYWLPNLMISTDSLPTNLIIMNASYILLDANLCGTDWLLDIEYNLT